MNLTRTSACKVNLVLNILGRRTDGFHELETLFLPVPLHDEIEFQPCDSGLHLTCTNPALPTDGSNLVWRAAEAFRTESGIRSGVRMHLRKNLPIAAGIGAGSANAATTLLALNELFGHPLPEDRLDAIAATLGSDVNFFLQPLPALATGRGEQIRPVPAFEILRGSSLLLYRPAFGIATPWAFRELGKHPALLNGANGKAASAADQFAGTDLAAAAGCLFNSLEVPVFSKYPILAEFQVCLREAGAMGTLMSGSGSTTFGLFASPTAAERAAERLRSRHGDRGWLVTVPL